ncbi:MAG TPA: peptidylprolyl isomerase [Solirubrobacterales bacterium]
MTEEGGTEGTQLDQRLIILGVFALVAVAIVAAILISRGGGGSGSSSAGGCEEVEPPQPKNVGFKAPKQTVQKGEEVTAVVETSCGTFDIALASQEAPKTVNSFVFLSEEGFYDGLDFHRVVPEFVIQGGDPLGNGTGGPGYKVTEKPPANLKYTRGVVAMAKGGTQPPGTSGSQFFVVTGAEAGLPPEYALLGNVSKGIDVVEQIGEVPIKPNTEEPEQTVLIEHVEIERG